MLGLYLKDAAEIATGRKTAIAAKSALAPGERQLIVKQVDGSYAVTGRVIVGAAQVVDLKEFDAQHDKHLVSKAQRRQWWPEAEMLVIHPLTHTHTEPYPLDIAPGTTQDVELQGLGIKELDVVDGYYIYEVE